MSEKDAKNKTRKTKYLTVRKALQELKVNEEELKKMVDRGEIKAIYEENEVKFDEEEITQLKLSGQYSKPKPRSIADEDLYQSTDNFESLFLSRSGVSSKSSSNEFVLPTVETDSSPILPVLKEMEAVPKPPAPGKDFPVPTAVNKPRQMSVPLPLPPRAEEKEKEKEKDKDKDKNSNAQTQPVDMVNQRGVTRSWQAEKKLVVELAKDEPESKPSSQKRKPDENGMGELIKLFRNFFVILMCILGFLAIVSVINLVLVYFLFKKI